MAILLDKYGDAYDSGSWKVGINGVLPTPDGFAQRLTSDLAANLASGSEIEVAHANGARTKAQAVIYPRSVVYPTLVNGKPAATIGFFGIKPQDFKGDLVAESGVRLNVAGTSDASSITVPLPANMQGQSLHIEGSANGLPIESSPQTICFDPIFDLAPDHWNDWKVQGAFGAPFSHPTRKDFGLPADSYVIGTCEDGQGGFNDGYRGRITSPPFVITKPKITLLVSGGSGDGEYVELVDYLTGERLATAHGANDEKVQPVTWDTSKYKNRALVIRLIDYETGAWGHINVADIRCE